VPALRAEGTANRARTTTQFDSPDVDPVGVTVSARHLAEQSAADPPRLMRWVLVGMHLFGALVYAAKEGGRCRPAIWAPAIRVGPRFDVPPRADRRAPSTGGDLPAFGIIGG
jgi:hypothetical protein